MLAEVDKRIRRALGSIRRSFRGVINLINAAGSVQLVKGNGLAGEQLSDNEYFQHYGYTSNPPAGTMAVVIPIGGKTAHGIIVATEHGSFRLKGLKPGETAIYTKFGDKVVIHDDGTIEVVASTKVQITSPLVTMSGELHVTGNIIGAADIYDHTSKSMRGMRETFDGHVHTGDSGGTTGIPTGAM